MTALELALLVASLPFHYIVGPYLVYINDNYNRRTNIGIYLLATIVGLVGYIFINPFGFWLVTIICSIIGLLLFFYNRNTNVGDHPGAVFVMLVTDGILTGFIFIWFAKLIFTH